jgi:ABC-type nitrate/sulfonate/bicarbonate transport system permease component
MKHEQLVDRAIAAGIALLLFGWWEVASRSGWISTLAFPPPSRIVANFAVLWDQGLLQKVGYTLGRFAAGALIGAVPAILLGLLVGSRVRLNRIIDPFIAAMHPIPKIVLFPLFIVIFGVSDLSKLASIALTVFFPAFINSAAGARSISPLYFEVVRNYGGRRRQAFWYVLLPGSAPMILTGIRIAANVGLLVTIAIEFTMTSNGIGSIIWLAWQTMKTEDLYAGVITLSLIGVLINSTIRRILRQVMPWQAAA